MSYVGAYDPEERNWPYFRIGRKGHTLERQPRIVAVVEDDPSMRRSLERLLNAHGFMTEGYSSAETFLGRDPAHHLSCVVLDIQLAGMSGLELRSRLTSSGSSLPVVFITAIDDDTLKVAAVQLGCSALLRKPFPAASLISAVNKALAVSPTD